MFYIHSVFYIVLLFVVAGLFNLLVDLKGYRKKKKMKKEKKVTRFLGWLNLSLGVFGFIANWVYHHWIW